MTGRGKVQKVMVQPINLIFRYLQGRTRVQLWLYEDVTHRIEGYIIVPVPYLKVEESSHYITALLVMFIYDTGFDEYMNIVLDEAEEVNIKTQNRNKVNTQPLFSGVLKFVGLLKYVQVGRILLKGDNITLIHSIQPAA